MVVTAMDVGVVIFGTGGGAIGGMRIAAGSGGGAMDVVEIMATKKGRVRPFLNIKDRVLRVLKPPLFGPQIV